MRPAALLLAALAAAAPCRAIEPASNFRIEVASAAVTGLECRRRPFRMEWTRGVGQRYSRTAAEGFARSPDLRTVSLGICAMVLMAPLAVLAVPATLVIGVGINLAQREFPPELAGRATSVALETGQVKAEYSRYDGESAAMPFASPASSRASARSKSCARLPTYQRRGCGSAGKRCIGGRPESSR